MRHQSKEAEEESLKILKRLGVETERDGDYNPDNVQAPRINPNPYGKPMLEVIMERQDEFGKSCDPGYRTIKEQEEDEENK